jgi:hypothetical protein
MFDDVKVARELYVGYSGIHGAEAAIFQPQRLFAVDQLFFTWPQFRRKTRKHLGYISGGSASAAARHQRRLVSHGSTHPPLRKVK